MSDPIPGPQAHTWKIEFGYPGLETHGLYVGGVAKCREKFAEILAKLQNGRIAVIGPSGHEIHWVIKENGKIVDQGF
jgi:hypothetical protein